MDNKINELKEKIERIEHKLDNITKILENSVELNCERMGNHITFIEQIYENVKLPLIYFCSMINYLSINNNVNYLSLSE